MVTAKSQFPWYYTIWLRCKSVAAPCFHYSLVNKKDIQRSNDNRDSQNTRLENAFRIYRKRWGASHTLQAVMQGLPTQLLSLQLWRLRYPWRHIWNRLCCTLSLDRASQAFALSLPVLLRNDNRVTRRSPGELTKFVEVVGVLLLEEPGGEDEGPLDDDVGEAGERPPAHEQTVGLG